MLQYHSSHTPIIIISILYITAVVVIGFSQTEITVPEDMGSFGVGLEVFSPPPELIGTSFREAINTGTAQALFNIVAMSDSANGKVVLLFHNIVW